MSFDILASEPGQAPASRRWSPLRGVLIGVVVLLVVALIAGVTVAVRGLSGGGSQPEDVLPAGAFAFAKVDLDPPAGQKIDAIRFMRKFPALRDKVSVNADLRKALFEAVSDSAGWQRIDYAKDVEPWLGKRLGVAAYKPTGAPAPATDEDVATPGVVVALQINDEGKAKAGIARLADATPGRPHLGVVVQDGFALLAQTQAAADKAAKDAKKGTVAKDDTFAGDMKDLGDGIAAAWVDMDAASSALGSALAGLGGVGGLGMAGLGGSAGTGGRASYVLKFDGADALELRGSSTGGVSLPGSDKPLQGFSELPSGSLAAFGVVGGDKLVPVMFDALGKSVDKSSGKDGGTFDDMVAQTEKELGIKLPEDLSVLVGSNLVASLDGVSLRDSDVQLGAHVTTDGARAEAVLAKIEKAARGKGEDLPIYHRRTGDGVVVASSRREADRLLAKGKLGDNPRFRKALPDVDGATVALWVDVQALVKTFMGTGEVDKNLEPIDGVGMTASVGKAGASTFRLRLVVH